MFGNGAQVLALRPEITALRSVVPNPTELIIFPLLQLTRHSSNKRPCVLGPMNGAIEIIHETNIRCRFVKFSSNS